MSRHSGFTWSRGFLPRSPRLQPFRREDSIMANYRVILAIETDEEALAAFNGDGA